MDETKLTEKLCQYYYRYATEKREAWSVIYEMKFKELKDYILSTDKEEKKND